MSSYIDTSALAKWYFPEEGSDAFEAWFQEADEVWISSLVALEFRSLVARRLREKELSAQLAARMLTTFSADVRGGFLPVRPVEHTHYAVGEQIFEECSDVALRTLDALHLAIARSGAADELVTSDQLMADAAERLGFMVRFFGRRRKRTGRR